MAKTQGSCVAPAVWQSWPGPQSCSLALQPRLVDVENVVICLLKANWNLKCQPVLSDVS